MDLLEEPDDIFWEVIPQGKPDPEKDALTSKLIKELKEKQRKDQEQEQAKGKNRKSV